MDEATKRRIQTMLGLLNERQRRLYLAVEVQSLGYGGLKEVCELTGVAKSTIILGQKELASGVGLEVSRVRKVGSGHKLDVERNECLKVEIEKLMEPPMVGGVEPVLRWTNRGLRDLAGLLCAKGFSVSHKMVGTLLCELGYCLRLSQRMLHFGGVRPDRDVQFRYVNAKCREFLAAGEPVVSVVSDEKELLFDFRHIVMQYCKSMYQSVGEDFDFPVEQVAGLASLDVFEVNGFLGFVNLGELPGMVDFGVEGLLRWWRVLGRHVFPDTKRICVVSDGGGRGGVWYKLWKKQLQVFADVSGLEVHVLYLPPSTSKWHTVRHELFCFTNDSLAEGVPVSVRVGVKMLSSVAWGGVGGLLCGDDVVFGLDLMVTDEELSELNLVEDELYGHWNYVIRPK
ncbi:MAG: ISAzo13 family transposase [Nitrososphaerota archaeon]|jgi:hypothetical protein|nr:ISAzo13 family transposase [Nitrososphaerota archaeon]